MGGGPAGGAGATTLGAAVVGGAAALALGAVVVGVEGLGAVDGVAAAVGGGVVTAVDPSGQFMGAYQIYQGGWDAVARSMGRTDLVGRRPNTASPADQDAVALAMLRMYGRSPWGGACG